MWVNQVFWEYLFACGIEKSGFNFLIESVIEKFQFPVHFTGVFLGRRPGKYIVFYLLVFRDILLEVIIAKGKSN